MRNLLLATLALAVSACGGTKRTAAVVLDQPTSVVVFSGVTSKNTGLHPYLAIANGARDDLTLVDALDDKAVLSPVLVRSLVVPTSKRPTQVVAASLYDGKADLLAVLPAGGSLVQVVRTWTANNQVVDRLDLDLSLFAPDGEILSVVAVPVPFNGTAAATPGRARLVFGLSGGRLAVVECTREPLDGPEGGDGVEWAEPVVQVVGFDAASLASSPDARLIYAATLDDLPQGSGIHGVVEIDSASEPGTWSTEMLPTRGPTRLVAAARVAERLWAENDVAIPETQPFLIRVYAVLDPTGCGPGRPIDCGIVVVDPSPPIRGIVPDPLGEMPYQPPIRLPSQATAIAAAIPPAVQPTGYQPGRMVILTNAGTQEATGVLVAAAQNGRVYTVDLGRRTVHSESSMLVDTDPASPERARVSALENVIPADTTKFQTFRLIVCDRATPTAACTLARTTTESRDAISVTPGYIFDDKLSVIYQGIFGGLGGRRGQTGDEGGQLWAALQQPTDTGFTDVVRLYDPSLGVHVGDIVSIVTKDVSPVACDDGVADDPDTTDVDESTQNVYEARIAGFAIPDPARFPGGALLLADDGSACYDALRAGTSNLVTTVRADGFPVQGIGSGYLGRAGVTTPDGEKDLRVRYELRYVNEDAPEQACPLSPWPANPELVTCLGECRERCERLSIARKSRRWYTLAATCDADADCRKRWGVAEAPNDAGVITSFTDPFPNLAGPVISFVFTVREPNAEAPVDGTIPEALERGHGLLLTAVSSNTPSYRVPGAGPAVMPTSVTAFDESTFDQNASYRFYVAYTGDVVMGYSPSQSVTSPVTIR